ncbi:Hypothetical protein A7982_05037 [Minicystis rosea]|nr:Hypothetical protein A7982_05037 [Minicystis rosea]
MTTRILDASMALCSAWYSIGFQRQGARDAKTQKGERG